MSGSESRKLLAVEELVAGYGALQVIHGASLHVDQGEAVALLGANGAGKTTMLTALMGLIPLGAGQVRFGGQDLTGKSSPQIAGAGMAIVPEGRGVFENLTVEENLIVGAWTNPARNESRIFEEVYHDFPRLKERRTQMAGTMSGGEQQMLAVARAILCNPKLMLIDEPSMGLAPKIVGDLYSTLARIRKSGISMLLVEQNVSRALDICTRGYVMERGQIVLEGTSEELKEDKRVIASYLGIER